MGVTNQPSIFVALPVFEGWELVEETIRSIRDQEFTDFRVLISIDGADERSAAVCSKYLDDERFKMVVQPERLGWVNNLNWLMSRCEAEFFCYWQQDDLCPRNYLGALREQALRETGAACVHADVQWFGGRCDRSPLASSTGSPKERVLDQVELGHFAPFRGLIRTRALRAAGPIRVTEYDSRLEDLIWLVKLAAQGEFHRNTETLYFKRLHRANTHSAPKRFTEEFKRGVWIEYGLGLMEAILPVFRRAEYPGALDIILERLLVSRAGRWSFYDPWQDGPAGLVRFANDFIDAVVRRFGPEHWARHPRLPDAVAVLSVLNARRNSAVPCPHEQGLIDLVLQRGLSRIPAQVSEDGRWSGRTCAGEAGALLLESGWSTPEDWGMWTNAITAGLRIPLADHSRWRVSLTGQGFVGGSARGGSFTIQHREQILARGAYTVDEPRFVTAFEVQGEGHIEGVFLEITVPDAISPAEAGYSADTRLLGIALEAIEIEDLSIRGEDAEAAASLSGSHSSS